MIDYGLFKFATAPGTGGDWFMIRMYQIGLKGSSGTSRCELHPLAGSACAIPKCCASRPFDNPNGFKVSLVMNPIKWLYWLYRKRDNLLTSNDTTASLFVDKRHRQKIACDEAEFGDKWEHLLFLDSSSSFPIFVQLYLQVCPGAISSMFLSYDADSFLRIEDMPQALSSLVKSLGIDYSGQFPFFDLVPPMDLAKEIGSVKSEFIAAEKVIYDAFDYFI